MFYRCAIPGVLLSSLLSSQTITGSITGTLTDPAKAAVAAAKEVTGVGPILQTEFTATGVSLTGERLSSILLNGRNFATLTEVLLLTNAGKRE
jgi:hypothetical protein